MANYSAIEADTEGSSIRLRFAWDSAGVIGWQLFDPDTGAFLYEGEWSEAAGPNIDLRIALPAEDGPYRVQVAPVSDRGRFIAIDARVEAGAVAIQPPRVETAAAQAGARLVRAIPRAFTLPVRSIWNNRRLIRSMVSRDIAARYQGSFGGVLWTFLNPLLLMATYFFVFGVVLETRFAGDQSRAGYVLYFLAGMLPWLAIAEAVGRAPSVILEYRNFVKKLVYPLDTLPVNLVIAGLVTELFGVVIFVCGLFVLRDGIPASIVWLPILLIPQLLLSAGLAWLLAAAGVFVRDLGQVIGFLMTLWFFLTPICYAEEAVPAAAARILAYNPLLVLVRGYRAILLEQRAPFSDALVALYIGSAALAVLGYAWFHRLRKSFADVI
jgi:lipopolysaccharide transport system permease protein